MVRVISTQISHHNIIDKRPANANKRTTPPIIAATIIPFLLSKSSAITTPTHSYSVSTLSTHEIPADYSLPWAGSTPKTQACSRTGLAWQDRKGRGQGESPALGTHRRPCPPGLTRDCPDELWNGADDSRRRGSP